MPPHHDFLVYISFSRVDRKALTGHADRVKNKRAKAGNDGTENGIEAGRSRLMAGIGSRDTSIEVVFRKELWRAGVRYRKNLRALPGTPDIAITKYRIAVFCDGEFWHGKDWHLVREKLHTRRDFWVNKIERNIERDNEVERRLDALGWTCLRFWGRDIHRNLALCVKDVLDAVLQRKVETAMDRRPVQSEDGPDPEICESDLPSSG